jgi:hypothetical protein
MSDVVRILQVVNHGIAKHKRSHDWLAHSINQSRLSSISPFLGVILGCFGANVSIVTLSIHCDGAYVGEN